MALLVVRPLVVFVATLLGATLLVEVLVASAPGNAADLAADDPALRDALVEAWGLDRPVLERWMDFVSGALRGELGASLTYRPGAPVAELVAQGAASSLPLLAGAMTLGMGLALALAWTRRGAALVRGISVAPVFLLAYASMSALNEITFGLMESGRVDRPDWFALPDQDSALKSALAITVLAVGSSSLAELRAVLAEELQGLRESGWAEAARARGAPLWPHLLLNLVPPLTALAASRLAFFVGGLVVVEKVLHLNGLGAMLWQACRLRDPPLVLGLTVVCAAVVAAGRLVGDLVRMGVDPRLRT